MYSESFIELAIGSVLIVLGIVLLAFPRMTTRLMDASAGRTAERWARAGFDFGLRHYYGWQRSLLRVGLPLVFILTGVAFVVGGLS